MYYKHATQTVLFGWFMGSTVYTIGMTHMDAKFDFVVYFLLII